MSLRSRLRRATKQFRASGRGGPNVFLRVVHAARRDGRPEREQEIVRATCNGTAYARSADETLKAFEHRVLADQPTLPAIVVLYPSLGVPIAPETPLARSRAIPEGIQ